MSLVEPDRHDGAPPPHHAYGISERRRTAGALERHGHSLRTELVLQPGRNVSIRTQRLESDRTRDVQARGQPIDRVDDRRSRRFRHLPDEKTDRAATENDRQTGRVPTLGERNGVDSDREHLGEIDPVVEGELGREKLRQSIGRSERGELGMKLVAEDTSPFGYAIGTRFHDDARGAISEDDRVRHGRRSVNKEP